MLPTHPSCRHRIFRHLDLFIVAREQRGSYVVGIDGLGEIIIRAELHRIHHARYVAVTGEDDGAGFRATLFDGRYDIKAATAAAKAHVHEAKAGAAFSTCSSPSPTDSAVVTVKPRPSMARARHCRNDLSSSTIRSDRSVGSKLRSV